VLKEPGIANTRGSFLTFTAVPSINHQIDHPHVMVFAFVRLLHHHLFLTRLHAHGLISCGIVQGQIGTIPGATFWHVIRERSSKLGRRNICIKKNISHENRVRCGDGIVKCGSSMPYRKKDPEQ
jgi:hypothetical protein